MAHSCKPAVAFAKGPLLYAFANWVRLSYLRNIGTTNSGLYGKVYVMNESRNGMRPNSDKFPPFIPYGIIMCMFKIADDRTIKDPIDDPSRKRIHISGE